jgi:glycosyltransferase involved in cell wall biosynthesis
MPPRVSVIMPVYNGEKYLREAIESILGQTFVDFEFIIVDDASQDCSLSIMREFALKDKRIRVIENEGNLGISVSLNKCVQYSRGEYIARMDADDISVPQRLETQVAFMDINMDIGICGTGVEYIEDKKIQIELPSNHAGIYARMLFENALAHPSVMMRTVSVREHSLYYDEKVRYAQDYELWSRAVSKVKLANIAQVLLYYRIHSQRIGSWYGKEQHGIHGLIYRRLLAQIGVDYTDENIQLHQQISIHQYGSDIKFLRSAQNWLATIHKENASSHVISSEALDDELTNVWASVCRQSALHPVWILFYLLSRPFGFHTGTGLREILTRVGILVRKSQAV